MGVARSWKGGTSDSGVVFSNIGMLSHSVSKLGVKHYFSKGNDLIVGGKLFDFFNKIGTSGCLLDLENDDIRLLTESLRLVFNGSTGKYINFGDSGSTSIKASYDKGFYEFFKIAIKDSLKLNNKERSEFINNYIFDYTLGTGWGIRGQLYFNENFLCLFVSRLLNEN
jgi:hypothetical protein